VQDFHLEPVEPTLATATTVSGGVAPDEQGVTSLKMEAHVPGNGTARAKQ
jgi:hypothetical protein